MTDEYYTRYQGYSHRELYNQLVAGEPAQVEAQADTWGRVHNALATVADQLEADLADLMRVWDSDAGAEFARRVSLVTSFTRGLAADANDVRAGLNLMANALQQAKSNAESPEETDDHDKAIIGGLIGSVAGPIGAAGGALIGDQMDRAERERAHQRMIQLVARLAASYQTTGLMAWPTDAATVPAGLPGELTPTGPGAGAGPTPRPPASGPGTGTAVATAATAATTGVSGDGELASVRSAAAAGGGGDQAGGSTMVPGSGGGATGSALLGAGAAAGVGLAGSIRGTAAPLRAPDASLRPGSQAASRLLSANPGPTATSTGTSASGASGHQSAAVGRGVGSRGMTGMTESAARAGAVGLGGQSDEDEEAQRRTWLTEDDMVWSDGQRVPPPVLGDGGQ